MGRRSRDLACFCLGAVTVSVLRDFHTATHTAVTSHQLSSFYSSFGKGPNETATTFSGTGLFDQEDALREHLRQVRDCRSQRPYLLASPAERKPRLRRNRRPVAVVDSSVLPLYCSDVPPPRLIMLHGERHSGTNLIQSLINENTNLQQNHQYGWKHGVLRPEDKFDACSDVLLIVARDAFSWILKMFHEPYNMIFDDGMEDFGPFLQGKFRSQKWEHEEYYRARGVNCSFPMERADNVVKLRTMKYRNWLTKERPSFIYNNLNETSAAFSDPELIRSFVQYESLNARGQGTVMGDIFRRHCIPYRTPLKEFTEYRGQDTEDRQKNDKQKFALDHNRVLNMYTTDELRFVLQQLDLDFERDVLHYTYEYVEDHIRAREANETNSMYRGPPKLPSLLFNRRKELAQKFSHASYA